MRKHRHFAVIITMTMGAGLLAQHSATAQSPTKNNRPLAHVATRRSHAEPPPFSIEAVALRPGSGRSIDPFLAPTLSATKLPAPAPAPSAPSSEPAPVTAPTAGPWPALRQCESSDNYADDTGNGYYGAYQFSLRTWEALGYGGLPSDAPPAIQDQAARRLQALAGWGQWPVCSRRLGLD